MQCMCFVPQGDAGGHPTVLESPSAVAWSMCRVRKSLPALSTSSSMFASYDQMLARYLQPQLFVTRLLLAILYHCNLVVRLGSSYNDNADANQRQWSQKLQCFPAWHIRGKCCPSGEPVKGIATWAIAAACLTTTTNLGCDKCRQDTLDASSSGPVALSRHACASS